MPAFVRALRPAARALPALALLTLSAASALAQTGGSDLFKGFGANSRDPIQIEADSLEVRDQESLGLFTGNVQVRQKDTTLKTGKLKVFYEGKATGGSVQTQQIRRFEAEGKVIVTQGDQSATSDTGWFDMRSQTAQMVGSVVLIQGKNVAKGEKLAIDLRTGLYRLEGGRVRMLIEPQSEPKPGAKP